MNRTSNAASLVIFVASTGWVAAPAGAVVIPAGAVDSVFVDRGIRYSSGVKLGAIHGLDPSNQPFQDSFTFLTDLSGNRYTIGDTPSTGSTLWLGGYGRYGSQNQADHDKDGNPRVGNGPRATPSAILFNQSLYGGVFFDPSSFGLDNVYANHGDSGGGVWDGESVIGTISAGSSGDLTEFTRLDAIRNKLNEVMADPSGIYGLAAAHSVKGATLDYVSIGNFNNPTLTLKVDSVYINPDWQGTFGGLDGAHSDYALLKLSVVPEPTGFAILSLTAVGQLRRRRKSVEASSEPN